MVTVDLLTSFRLAFDFLWASLWFPVDFLISDRVPVASPVVSL